MRKGIVINLVPVFADKSAYEQQQCGLWLMEIGYQGLDDMIAIPGSTVTSFFSYHASNA